MHFTSFYVISTKLGASHALDSHEGSGLEIQKTAI